MSGLPARSSTLTTRGEAISMSFGFDLIGPPLRRERLENEPHFLRFRSLMKTNSPQTISSSFMSLRPRHFDGALEKAGKQHCHLHEKPGHGPVSKQGWRIKIRGWFLPGMERGHTTCAPAREIDGAAVI